MMEWTGQKVVILGAARQGLALARYLARHGAQVTLNDRRPADELQEARAALADLPVGWVLGGHPEETLAGADLLCLSGGVPLDNPLAAAALERGIPLSNDSQIFLEAAPCPVIGITGSAGKTTTTTLVGRMAEASLSAPNRACVGGNIGAPLISGLDEMRPGDLAVMELSSFQLEIMTRSPQVAAITNITPNHLDRHRSMQVYTAAKARILDFQTPDGAAVLNREDRVSWGLAGRARGRLLSFGQGELAEGQAGTFLRGEELYLRQEGAGHPEARLMSRRDILLRGEHNLLNVLAACAIGAAARLPLPALQAGVQGFTGVAHRLEFVRSWGRADWYNDSIATAPERAMAAIRSFSEPLILLAGGRDKDLPWEEFAALVRRRVDHLIVFGEAAEKIARAVGEGAPEGTGGVEIYRCAGLKEAVAKAASIVQTGDIVLLSPGGTSFDEFRDFEERGQCFRELVMQL